MTERGVRAGMWTSVCLNASPQVQMRPESGWRAAGALAGVGVRRALAAPVWVKPGLQDGETGKGVQGSWRLIPLNSGVQFGDLPRLGS